MNHEISTMEKNAHRVLARIQSEYESVFPGSGLIPRFVRCDEATKTLELAYDIQPWMRNPAGLLHGGITATMLDNSMGSTVSSIFLAHTPTITMTVNYLRPIPLADTIHVRSHMVLEGRTAAHLTAEVFMPDAPDRILATATGVYYTKKA